MNRTPYTHITITGHPAATVAVEAQAWADQIRADLTAE